MCRCCERAVELIEGFCNQCIDDGCIVGPTWNQRVADGDI
ncbi:hypothetical protein SEA_GIANTSBANE_88 [Arthrobacter phage Giantsbane]|nr:hypothetical protein SEA_GIANTSBANE_88 [Arthrobacter phage Giantsbane]